jgi:hypothetical protein
MLTLGRFAVLCGNIREQEDAERFAAVNQEASIGCSINKMM